MNLQGSPARKQEYVPPAIDGDFYRIADLLNDDERAVIKRVREFMEKEVAPIIEDYWARDKFPFEIVPQMAKLGIGSLVAGPSRSHLSGESISLSALTKFANFT